MFAKIVGFILMLFGLGVIVFGLYASYQNSNAAWAVGCFIIGIVVIGCGCAGFSDPPFSFPVSTDDPTDEDEDED